MADVEAYCDSDEEVFFGPVTEKERKIAENLRRRAIINQNYRSCTSTTESQDGEEGLHTLAMAAQMLSLSCDNGESHEDTTEYKTEKYQSNECCTMLPPVDTITRGIIMNTNEGSHLELDAVKFLSRHIPEQNQSEFFQDSAVNDKSGFCNTPGVHIASMVSCMNNERDVLDYWSNSDNSDHMISFHKCQNGAEKQIGDSICSQPHISNVEVVYPKEEAKAPDIIPEIDYKYDILGTKANCMDWEDANEISKGEFGTKLSDNEEEMEKVERNLKVEEIIKFLADEDDKSKGKLLSEANVKQSPVYGLSDSKMPDYMPFVNADVHGNGIDQLPLDEVYQDPLGPKVECKSEDTLNVTNVLLETPKVEISLEEVKSEGKEDGKVERVIGDNILVEPVKDEDKKAYQLGSLTQNLESFKGQTTEASVSSESNRKPHVGSALKKPSSNYKRVPTPKVTPGMEKRPATPRPSRTPNSHPELGKYQSASRPLRPLQSPALDNAASKNCTHFLQQEDSQQAQTPFKTPTAKAKPAVKSKIPHLCSFSPSPNKNKKFAGIVSPVSQYIHSKPVVLITNKKQAVGSVITTHMRNVTVEAENKSPKKSVCATPELQSLPDVLGERGAENIDVTNYSTLPEVHFKSALPVKIFAQTSSPKTPKTGTTAIVTKHLGHVKLSSIESGKTVPSLPFECRESMLPNGEVSLLFSKEVELHCPTLLRN